MFAALLLAGCKSPDPPGGFGVNLTIKADALSSTVRDQIVSLKLLVRGEITPYEREIPDVATAVGSGELRLRYIPGMTTGQLGFRVLALDAGKQAVASSEAEVTVTLTGVQSVSATLTLVAGDLPDMSVIPKKKQGASCGPLDQCETPGGCVDGVCCNETCGDPCKACNVSGREGVCSPVANGMTPAHGNCGPDAVSGCQRDGKCNGSGACRLHPLGTVCRPSTCASGMFTPNSTCDGNGLCRNLPSIVCDPFTCKDASVCRDTCANSGECKPPNTCSINNSCGTKPDGSSCSDGSQCTSTFCADGVCCNNACTGACKTCSLVTPGTCSNVPAGQDPDVDCPAGAGSNAVCSPGACNGAGACNQAVAGTACAAACVSGAPSNTVCDAAGACATTVTGTTCNAACQDCTVSGDTSSCVNKGAGTVCANAFCSGATQYGRVFCSNGSCPSQGASGNCGLYACYITGSGDPACYTDCGCCSRFCLCKSIPSHCAPGRSCNTNTSPFTCQ